jgi:hypothetical protein
MDFPQAPNHDLQQIVSSVTPIRYGWNDDIATGFFYNDGRNVYLVTNLHALEFEDDGEQREITIFTRESDEESSRLSYHRIPLISEDGLPNWITHPDEDTPNVCRLFPKEPEIDLAAIPLDDVLDVNFQESGSWSLSQNHFYPDNLQFFPGQRVIIMGYPYRVRSPYYPITRSGFAAKHLYSTIDGDPCLAIEATMHSGTSGSPVLAAPDSLFYKQDGELYFGGGPHIIGVHSGNLSEPRQMESEEGPLYLNKAWYIELVEEMVQSHSI